MRLLREFPVVVSDYSIHLPLIPSVKFRVFRGSPVFAFVLICEMARK